MLRLVLFPYIYHTLSEAVSQYLRGKGIPTLAWLDDFWLTNERATQHESSEDQARAAHSAICLALTVFYKCGYFMSFSKCSLAPSTRRVYLGVICDSQTRRFEIPTDKLDKLEALIRQAIDNAWISFVNLENLAGKCTSMSVAVPPASLYTYHMYRQIARFRRTGGSSILARVNVPPNGGLRYEMEQWLAVRKRMNGASWYDPTHHSVAITGTTDESSQGWGGVVRSPHISAKEFRAAADFPPDFAQAHINIKETFALHKMLRLLVDDQPEYLRGSTATIDVDNTTMFYSVRNGRANDERMHRLVCQLFWLQVEADFTLKLRLVPSKDNAVADALTRPENSEHVRLGQKVFDRLWNEWGGFDMDLMATTASSQRSPSHGDGHGRPLPFYSRYHTAGSSGIDVLAQDVGRMPSSTDPCFGYCFPPPQMVWVVTTHLRECRARAVIIIPTARLPWFPLVASASVRSLPVANPQESNVFFRVHHLKGESPFIFSHWGMRAVEVDFRMNDDRRN